MDRLASAGSAATLVAAIAAAALASRQATGIRTLIPNRATETSPAAIGRRSVRFPMPMASAASATVKISLAHVLAWCRRGALAGTHRQRAPPAGRG